jgi:methionyl-tRNA formyltransferase
MIDSIILLNNGMMNEKIESNFRAINPDVKVTLIQDLVNLVELPEALLRKSRLIAYLSGLIVPLAIIKKLGYGAYNFHSGPPTRPGFASLEMAIYEGDEIFATTLHELDELVDTGKINSMHAFPIPKNITAPELFTLVLNSMMTLFERNNADLLKPKPLAVVPIPWGNKKMTKAESTSFFKISRDISQDEFDLRFRAFGHGISQKLQLIEDGNIYEIENDHTSKDKLEIDDFHMICGKKFIRRKY